MHQMYSMLSPINKANRNHRNRSMPAVGRFGPRLVAVEESVELLMAD